jgi:6-phosphogluconolactonase
MQPRTLVYVSCATDQHITILELDQTTGSLRELARTDVPGTDASAAGSLPLALSPDRTRLYAGLRAEPWPVASFAIHPTTGELTLLSLATLADSMCYLSTDATGRTLFSASYSGAKLATNPITEAGLAGDPAQILATPPKAHSALPSPDNRFLYAASLGGDAILCQAFDAATGRLAPAIHIAARTAPGAGPRHLAFAQGGRILYVLNELDGTLITFARDPATGALIARQTLSLLPEAVPLPVAAADLHITPNGRFLYASERLTDTLNGFAINPADGTLTPICRVPSETTPRGFAIAPSGRWLLCAGLTSGALASYAIRPDGTLACLASLPVGRGANWVEIIEL